MSSTWWSKYDLARHFGLYTEDDRLRIWSVERKVASGEWPAHIVCGEIRFSPADRAAIEEMVIHPATRRRDLVAEVEPEPPYKAPRETTRRKNTSTKTSNGWDLTPIPLSDCRGKSA